MYLNKGRNPRTLGALAAAAAFLSLLYCFGTMPWILIFLSLFALPALFDIILNPAANLEMTDKILRWKNPLQSAEIETKKIRSARFDTRLDISIRVSLTLQDGSTLRIPQDVLPPRKQLEKAFQDRGIKVEMHHFQVI